MNGVEKIASVISCGIMDLQYDGFGCQNMNIVHFHEYVQERVRRALNAKD